MTGASSGEGRAGGGAALLGIEAMAGTLPMAWEDSS
jgi:hypothetical protein